MQVKKLFIFAKLSLKSHIWENNWPSLACKCKCSLKVHVVFLHKISNNNRSTSGNTSMTMN